MTTESQTAPTSNASLAHDGTAQHNKSAPLHGFSWPLPNNTLAELRLTGGPITQEHLEMLRQYVELAKAAVPKTVDN